MLNPDSTSGRGVLSSAGWGIIKLKVHVLIHGPKCQESSVYEEMPYKPRCPRNILLGLGLYGSRSLGLVGTLGLDRFMWNRTSSDEEEATAISFEQEKGPQDSPVLSRRTRRQSTSIPFSQDFYTRI